MDRIETDDVYERRARCCVAGAQMLEALRRIPLEHQVVLELYFWEPMSASEIATVLDVPEGTIRTRIRRAKQLLCQQLEELGASTATLEETTTDLEGWAMRLRDAAGA